MELIVLVYYLSLFVDFSKTDESFCVLNGKKSLNYVSDKFISFTIDPIMLFTDLNISETARELGKYLTPAYVRIAGPSTKYLEFSENEEDYRQKEISKSPRSLVYTPSCVDFLNEWFLNTNLTMIFALNDDDKVDGKWNSKSIFPILELSAQMNSNCLWQLGYDTNGLTFEEYQENIKLLNNVLAGFPIKKNECGVISNEINKWSETSLEIRRSINGLHNVSKAIFWESASTEENFPGKDEMTKLLSSPTKPPLPIWTTIPKSENPVTFSSTLTLAKQVGEAAVLGYEAMFMKPRLYELMTETPNYWFILFYKNLMGRNVLDIKMNGIQKIDTYVYAHCTKNQNHFSRRGAITICVVNNGSYEHTTSLKPPINTINLKHIEVQSYILTSENQNSTNVYSNNKKLTMDLLKQNHFFVPKLRRARITKHLTLTVPPRSIGFFILPDARIPICINDEDETNLIMEEIEEAQEYDVTTQISEVKSRNFELKPSTLDDIYNDMKKELEVDEKFYGNQKIIVSSKNSLEGNVFNITYGKSKEMLGDIKEHIKKRKEKSFKDNFEDVTSQEIEEVVLKITKSLKEKNIRNRREAVLLRRIGRPHKRPRHRKIVVTSSQRPIKLLKDRPKRDINMKLLEEKAPKDGTFHSTIQKLQLKSSTGEEEFDDGDETFPRITNRFQAALEELLKPKPLDLSKIFHLKHTERSSVSKELNKEEREGRKAVDAKGTMEYLDETQDDYLEDLDLESYAELQTEFGKNLKNISVVNKEDNLGEQGGEAVKSLLNNHFINNHKVNDVIKKTIKNLQDYLGKNDLNEHSDETYQIKEDLELNEPVLENQDDYIDYDADVLEIRKKRQAKQFTEEDIANYRQLMNSNIRHMRDHIRKNKFKLITTKKEHVNLAQRINKLREAVERAQKSNDKEPAMEIITKPSVKKSNFSLDKIKATTTNNVKLNNVKLLKNRLAQHKLNQNSNDNGVLQMEIKSPKIVSNKEEVDDETKQLIRMIKDELRNRKPRNLKSFQQGENVPKDYVPRFKRYITKDKYKKYEDTINSINNIVKDGEYFIPKVRTSSDFSLELPTEDTSEIKQKHVESKEKVKGNLTSILITTENASKYLPGNTTNEFLIDKVNLTEGQNSDVEGTSLYNGGPLDNLFQTIMDFILRVREKMKMYLKYLDE